jgi:hypothetical protein
MPTGEIFNPSRHGDDIELADAERAEGRGGAIIIVDTGPLTAGRALVPQVYQHLARSCSASGGSGATG